MSMSTIRLLSATFLILTLTTGCRPPKVVQPESLAAPLHPSEAPSTEIPTAVLDSLRESFSRLHFELDSAKLTAESLQALVENAELLRKYKEIRVEVQGHADSRGTSEYNLALGEQRAQAVVRALAALGVASERLSTVSWGEERPLDSGEGERIWATNRRAELRVLTGGHVVRTDAEVEPG